MKLKMTSVDSNVLISSVIVKKTDIETFTFYIELSFKNLSKLDVKMSYNLISVLSWSERRQFVVMDFISTVHTLKNGPSSRRMAIIHAFRSFSSVGKL